MKKITLYSALLLSLVGLSRCDLNVIPTDGLTGQQITTTSDGLPSLVNGCYAIFKDATDNGNNWYLRQYYQLSDFASDDIVCAYKTEDDLINSFRYKDRTPEKSNINSFWAQNYKIIYGANVAIDMANKKGNDPLSNQLKGESYFLRAFATHNLVRLFAKPYSDANKTSPGVILREDLTDNKPKARATLEETYQYIISSLKTAADLMPSDKPAERSGAGFASKEAAWALLSRVYLYQNDWNNAIAYSDSVIGSGLYSLTTAENYANYFVNARNESETIWFIPFLTIDDKREGSIASMIYNGPSCWGEEGVSPSLMEAMGFGTEMQGVDQRWQLIETDNTGEKNGVTLYYVKKFSNQDNSATLSSPVMLRLAEVYLNRAEAYAHLGDVATAVDDLNTLLENRLIPAAGKTIDDYKYIAGSITADQIVDIVLNERRIELAFEGHRIFDLLRNGKDIVRNYWGFHLDTYNGVPASSNPGLTAGGVVFHANDPSDIYPIPVNELSTNKLCVPNQ